MASGWASDWPQAWIGLRLGPLGAAAAKDLPSSVMRNTPAGVGARIVKDSGGAPASSLEKTKPITPWKAISMRWITDSWRRPDSAGLCDSVTSYEIALRHRRAGFDSALVCGRLPMEAVDCGTEAGTGIRPGRAGVRVWIGRLAESKTLKFRGFARYNIDEASVESL